MDYKYWLAGELRLWLLEHASERLVSLGGGEVADLHADISRWCFSPLSSLLSALCSLFSLPLPSQFLCAIFPSSSVPSVKSHVLLLAFPLCQLSSPLVTLLG